MSSTVTLPTSTANQIVHGHKVTIVHRKSQGPRGPRAAHIDNSYFVPVDLLSLTVGKDAWMKDIAVRCVDCRTIVFARDLDCDMCPDCYEKAGDENAEMDGH
jgi:hypothetical protein